jgi:streptogrisin C
VTYAQGTVFEVVRTSACAEPGDSGGPFLAGMQGQGVLSGGSGNCTVGGTTFFQPVNEILATYGLNLVTVPAQCTGYANTFFAPITAYQGSFGRMVANPSYHPANGFTSTGSGTHSACLGGPSTANMRSSLQRYSCCGPFGPPQWTTVASTGLGSTVKTLATGQSPGTFRWMVTLEGGAVPIDYENDFYLLGTSSPA